MSEITHLGTWSYGAAALAFAVLALLLAISWRGRLAGALLIAAAVVNACWAASVAASTYFGPGWLVFEGGLELLRTGLWFAFLVALLCNQHNQTKLHLRPGSLGILWISALLLIAGFAVELFGNLWPLQWTANAYFGVRVLLAIVGLILAEQLYRGSSPDSRWTIKFLCLGVGALFCYDLVLYSDAMLFRLQDRDLWNGRGFANALIVPLVAVSAARNPGWSLEVAVSRRIIFQSTALLGTGVYLLLVATAGYYIRYFGGSWGGVLQTIVLFAGLLGLISLGLSGSLRARLKVFVNKNFFSYRYDYREEWLRITRALSTTGTEEDLGLRSIHALAGLVESRGGALWLRQEDASYERIAQWNAVAIQGVEPAGGALTGFLASSQWVLDLDEYRSSPQRYESLSVPDWLSAQSEAWLVVPLIFQEQLLGFVVLLQPRIELALDWEINDLLKTAGRQVAGYLAQLQATKALLVARQFESFNRMSAFVVHDLKNLVAQLSLLVSNSAKHHDNPEFQQDMLATVQNAAEKMKRLLSQLRAGATPVEQPIAVDIETVVQRAIKSKAPLSLTPEVVMEQSQLKALAHPERLERVIGHIVQNAVEATPPAGRIWVRIKGDARHAIVEIEDTGVGMSSAFIHTRLFRPFESTKPNGMGVGIYESRQYVRELGGELEVRSHEGQGTCFRIALPLLKSESKGSL